MEGASSARLPLHPALAVALYIIFLLFFVVPDVGVLALVGIFSLQAYWLYQALCFVSSFATAEGTDLRMRRLRAVLLYLAYFGFVVIVTVMHWLAAKQNVPGILGFVLALSSITSLFAANWIAARAICKAEVDARLMRHSAFATWLLLLYFPLGTPFIFWRLKKFARPLQSASLRPA